MQIGKEHCMSFKFFILKKVYGPNNLKNMTSMSFEV